MKHINKSQLLIISSVVLILASIPFLNFSSSSSTLNIGTDVLDKVSTGEKHVSRLYELILSSNGIGSGVKINIDSSNDQLNISNGIVVGSDSSSEGSFSSVGGGVSNKIGSSNNAGIAGGTNNTIGALSDNSVIGGGNQNTINGSNAVIAGGNENTASINGIVVGGNNNKASSNGVALGGQNNEGNDSSLVMGSGASGLGVFARNAKADQNTARIDAKSGVLIGTTESIQGVSLVVNGAVKINGSGSDINNGITGEIRVVNGCFYAYDGKYWHVISQANDSQQCTGFVSTEKCTFGNVYLQQGDQVTGYNATISTSCDPQRVVCSGGKLVTPAGVEGYDNPYCYKVN